MKIALHETIHILGFSEFLFHFFHQKGIS